MRRAARWCVSRFAAWEQGQAVLVARSQLFVHLQALAPEELAAWCARTRAMLDQAAASAGLPIGQVMAGIHEAPRPAG